MFSWESQPSKVWPDNWPNLSDVAEHLHQQHGRLRGVLCDLTEKQLSAPAGARPDNSVRYILRAFQDEASHAGEIWLLRKLIHKKHSQFD